MPRRLAVCSPLLAVALFVATTSGQAPAPAVSGSASLSGRITVTRDQQASPVRRARVTLSGPAGQVADSDTDGSFRFTGLPAGTYKVVVDKPGFVPAGRVPMVEIRDGQTATITVAMQRGGAIEGRILTPDGEPAMRLAVSAVRLGYGPYGKKPVSMRQTTTDDLGRFRLHTLQPGEYFIEAGPDQQAQFDAVPLPGNPPRPARTYYAGTPRLSEAGVVVVAAEQQVSNVSFTLVGAVTSSISGNVSTATGQIPATYSLRIQRMGAAPGGVSCLLNTTRPEDHSFTCPTVPAGDYWLLATSKATANADTEFSATRMTFQGQPMTNVAIRTAPGVTVSGRVTTEGGDAIPAGIQVAALETEYEFPNASRIAGPAVPAAPVGGDGTFGLGSVAGQRLIRLARAPENWAIQSVTLDGVDITDQPTTFAPSERPVTLGIVLTARTGTVSGTVVGENSQPATGTLAIVFAADDRRWGARSRFIRTAEVTPSGRYTVRGLLPGDYRVVFVSELPDGAWEDPSVLARLESDARRVTVAASATATVDGRVK